MSNQFWQKLIHYKKIIITYYKTYLKKKKIIITCFTFEMVKKIEKNVSLKKKDHEM